MAVPRSIKAGLAAGLLSLVLAFAFALPLTLHLRLPDRIEFVARYFCPETGQFAPRYFRSRSSKRAALEACLDSDGKRIEDRATHDKVVRTIGFGWTAVLFPLFFLIFKPLFAFGSGRRARIVASNEAQLRRARAAA